MAYQRLVPGGPVLHEDGTDQRLIPGGPLVNATVSSVITGTMAATEAADTFAATGDVIVSGSMAATEAADTFAGTGDVVVTGTLAATEASDTCSIEGVVTGGVVEERYVPGHKTRQSYYGPLPLTDEEKREYRNRRFRELEAPQDVVIPRAVHRAVQKVAQKVVDRSDDADPLAYLEQHYEQQRVALAAELKKHKQAYERQWMLLLQIEIEIRIRDLRAQEEDEEAQIVAILMEM